MRAAILCAVLALYPASANAGETTLIDTSVLPSKIIYEVAELRPLALTEAGTPAVVLVDLDAGDVVAPHPAPAVARIITVVSGTVWFGDGDELVEAQETAFDAGSVLVMPANQMHWAAARRGPVRLQLVVLDDEVVVPQVAAQLD
ncbi:MAG: cupin domain-containing protein [Pseudomonadota bacterium]